MLTPRFEIQQEELYITVKIFAPYARISDAEVSITEEVFTFYSSPYYLRLTFPGKLVDSELEEYSGKFDADARAFIIRCKKETEGEHFPNLDMLTKLLAPLGATGVNKPSIEVISNGSEIEKEEDEDFDFTYEQTLPEERIVTKGYKYGFGNSLSDVFTVLQSELMGVVDVKDPDDKSALQRREERIAQEINLFDEHHYLADNFDVDAAQQFIEFIPEFYSVTSDEVEFSEQDKEDMIKLPHREHLLDKDTKSIVFLGLVDILYAWCYNCRITWWENYDESAWTVAKLSSTLSWLDSFTSLKDVAVSSIRRSLTFPLIRNWLLSQQVLEDTATVLSLGKTKVLKCFFEIRRLFSSSESRYILNQLYIDDYCIWLQNVEENKFTSLGDSLRKVEVLKTDVGLNLDELESAAHLALKEESLPQEQNLNTVVSDMAGLTIIENEAVLGVSDNEALLLEPSDTNVHQEDFVHLSDSDSTSSESDSEEESDDTSDSSDSSEDSSEDSDADSSSDSSEFDSDENTRSENDN